MKPGHEDYSYSILDKEQLISISKSDFSIAKNPVCRLRCILVNSNCDNDVLEGLIQNKSTPFDKLEPRILDGIARCDIKNLELLLLAIERFKDVPSFMSAIKYNANYLKFIAMQKKAKKATDNFNRAVALNIEKLKTADTLPRIEKIKIKKTELEQQRQELLQQYPGAQLSDMSEFVNAIIATKVRAKSARSSTFTRLTPMFNSVSSAAVPKAPKVPSATIINRNPRLRYNY